MKKLNKKLQLNKVTIARLTDDQQSSFYGGADVSTAVICATYTGCPIPASTPGVAYCGTALSNTCPPAGPVTGPVDTLGGICFTLKAPLSLC